MAQASLRSKGSGQGQPTGPGQPGLEGCGGAGDGVWSRHCSAGSEAAQEGKEQEGWGLIIQGVNPFPFPWALTWMVGEQPRRCFSLPGLEGGLASVLTVWIKVQSPLGTGGG